MNEKRYTEKQVVKILELSAKRVYDFAHIWPSCTKAEIELEFLEVLEDFNNEAVRKKQEREEKRIMGLASKDEREYKKIINANKEFLADIPFMKK